MSNRDPKTGRWAGDPRNTIKPMVPVFVYGTLKQGYSNNLVMGNDARILGRGTSHDKFDMHSVSFPVIIENEQGHPVIGEVWMVPPKVLERLDSLEGEGRMYFRKRVWVQLGNYAVECYGYVGNPDYWRFGTGRGKKHTQLAWDGSHAWPEPEPKTTVEENVA